MSDRECACEDNRQRDQSGLGTLYVVATPIGNLEDITLRALRVLGECDLIASEDTRTTMKLLSRYGIHTSLTSYHQHSDGRKTRDILDLVSAGKNVALVSESGTPVISDPGHELIRGCIALGATVVPIPGCNALITLLSAAGLNTSVFIFLGFPPRATAQRKRYFEALASETRTMIFHESPNRLVASLSSMLEQWGDRYVCLGRELTKLHEEIWRGSLQDAVIEFGERRRPRGECVIGVEGAAAHVDDGRNLQEDYRKLISEGMDDKSAITALAKLSGWSRSKVYQVVLEWKGKR